jgi:hypothetical protein
MTQVQQVNINEPQGTPIDIEELLAAIGELYIQSRVLRKMLARSQNGQVDERN